MRNSNSLVFVWVEHLLEKVLQIVHPGVGEVLVDKIDDLGELLLLPKCLEIFRIEVLVEWVTRVMLLCLVGRLDENGREHGHAEAKYIGLLLIKHGCLLALLVVDDEFLDLRREVLLAAKVPSGLLFLLVLWRSAARKAKVG